MTPNLLPEKRPRKSLPRSRARMRLADLRDHLLGGVVAVGFVEMREVIDRDQQEAERAAEAQRLLELDAEHLGQVHAVHFSGQCVEFGELGERLLARVALCDGAHHADGAHRRLAAAGKPAAGVL